MMDTTFGAIILAVFAVPSHLRFAGKLSVTSDYNTHCVEDGFVDLPDFLCSALQKPLGKFLLTVRAMGDAGEGGGGGLEISD